MGRALRLATLGVPVGGGGESAPFETTMQDDVAASQLVRWYRFNEPSGTTLINYGSGGTALNGAVTSATIAQAGQLGAAEAYLFDGLNDYVSCPGGASSNLDTFTQMWLFKPLSNNQYGRIMSWGTANSAVYNTNATNYRPRLLREFATTSILLDYPSSGGITLEQWVLMFFTHDMAGDRKARMYLATTTTVSLVATSSSASAGAITDFSASGYFIGARGVPDALLHAAIDEHGLFSVALSTDQMNAIAAYVFAA